LTAAGGVTNGPTLYGLSPGNLYFNYKVYVGGAAVGYGYLVPGNAPGGGGGPAAIFYSPGGNGAPGAAWIYTYTNVDVPPQGLQQTITNFALTRARL